MPEPRDHAENRGWIETILRYIPGFRGYLEKEYRRESDTLQREWLTDRLERSKRGLDGFSRALVEAGNIDIMPQCDRLRGRIDKLCSRIEGAMKGYSGFFDLVEIDEEVLDRVYQFDAALVDRIDDFAGKVEDLEADVADADQVIKNLLEQTEEFERTWDEREDILKGLD
jgi:hypothetical protein